MYINVTAEFFEKISSENITANKAKLSTNWLPPGKTGYALFQQKIRIDDYEPSFDTH